MTVLVINVGSPEYSNYSLPLIQKLCDYNNVELKIIDYNLEQNTYKLHPSWLKLFCFDLIDDDFIVTWDCDLVPTHLYLFKDFFNVNLFNVAYDPGYSVRNFTFNGKFKYNCGLMGIPKYYSNNLKKIYYEKGLNSNYPSYEQYHVNDFLYDNNSEINLLSNDLNYLFDGNESFDEKKIKNMHYTWKINSENHRTYLIKKHYEKFSSNF